jgi:hypothetical protein
MRREPMTRRSASRMHPRAGKLSRACRIDALELRISDAEQVITLNRDFQKQCVELIAREIAEKSNAA